MRNVGESRLDEAASICNQFDAVLPLPRNDIESADLYAAAVLLGDPVLVALGATDVIDEGVWVDSTGSKLTYFDWPPTEPNNMNGAEHYLHFHQPWKVEEGKWNDHVGSFTTSVICEKPDGKFREKKCPNIL